jgi:hypothetical protein
VLLPLQLVLVIKYLRCKNPEPFELQKVPATSKYRNMRFSVSQKLNTKGGDFIGKFRKASKKGRIKLDQCK